MRLDPAVPDLTVESLARHGLASLGLGEGSALAAIRKLGAKVAEPGEGSDAVVLTKVPPFGWSSLRGPLHMSDAPCLIYLVRHGATPHNLLDPPRMQGQRINPSLAPEGIDQGRCVAEALAHKPVAAVYSSPLKRAVETAALIAAPHRLKPVTHAGLTEVDIGSWEDRSWDDIERNDPETYAAFRADPAHRGYPGGETLAELTARVVAAMVDIARDHPGREVVVVAHSVVNRVYVGELLYIPLALRRKVPQDNCGISVVECYGDKHRLRTLNGVVHLKS
jgi:broad specificity phosphatase PhoE